MPKPVASPALRDMLRDRNVALWDAAHYRTALSTGKAANAKDPVCVVLKIPEMPDRDFYGHGPNLDAAVDNAFQAAHNRALVIREGGVRAAVAKLEEALAGLWIATSAMKFRLGPRRYDSYGDELDDDVPF